MVTKKQIRELWEFLDADLPSKIFSGELIRGQLWTREDKFESKEQIRTYLENAFAFIIPELKQKDALRSVVTSSE